MAPDGGRSARFSDLLQADDHRHLRTPCGSDTKKQQPSCRSPSSTLASGASRRERPTHLYLIHHVTVHINMAISSIFEGYVVLKPALAAVVRALRDSLDLSQEELASAVSQTFLSRIENGHSSPTMDKFAELADALQLSPVALMALILSTIENTPTSIVLANAARELEAIEAKVSAADIAAHLAGNEVLKRPAARPADLDKLRKVLQCKADGLSKSESARRLGLSRSTIGFLWERSVPDAD